ncbi:MAG: class I SAM-dependent methyltransferase [Pseudomonadota bacterium]
MDPIPDDEEVARRLKRLEGFFDLKAMAKAKADQRTVHEYYRANQFAYSYFHSKSNVLHMGVSETGTFKEDDFWYQARHVEQLLPRGGSCLELAAGRAANSAYLAQRRGGSRFDAQDLSDVQLKFARRSERKLANLRVTKGDFHNLSDYVDERFDVVFVVEALCYSTDKKTVFSEVMRVLKPGGVFVIYDGYADRRIATRSEDEMRAARLLERGMAVPRFEPYDEVKAAAKAAGFKLHAEQNLSAEILPTCGQHERRAAKLMDMGFAGKMILKVLEKPVIYNVVVGYLFPILMTNRVFAYWSTTLAKPGSPAWQEPL